MMAKVTAVSVSTVMTGELNFLFLPWFSPVPDTPMPGSAGESKIRGMSRRPVFSLTHISTTSATTRGSSFWFLHAQERADLRNQAVFCIHLLGWRPIIRFLASVFQETQFLDSATSSSCYSPTATLMVVIGTATFLHCDKQDDYINKHYMSTHGNDSGANRYAAVATAFYFLRLNPLLVSCSLTCFQIDYTCTFLISQTWC